MNRVMTVIIALLGASSANAGICSGKTMIGESQTKVVLEAFVKATEYVAFPNVESEGNGAQEAMKRLKATRNGVPGQVVSVCTEENDTASNLYFIEIKSISDDRACGIHLETTKSGALSLPKIYKVADIGCAG